jgi:small subunit ribosomal protein S9
MSSSEAPGVFRATGRRKSAVAVVRLKVGDGKFEINKRDARGYLCRDTLMMVVQQPLEAVEMMGKVDIQARVHGGGLTGQAGALRHGIARALLLQDAEIRAVLKKGGYLTRDARKVERKKYGQPKARKRFQYSKR